MKKLLILMVSIVMVFSLAACGGNGGNGESGGSSESSNAYNLDMIDKLEEIMDEENQKYLASSPRYMLILLDYLREHYGSAYGYLLDIGFSEEEAQDIKEAFLI